MKSILVGFLCVILISCSEDHPNSLKTQIFSKNALKYSETTAKYLNQNWNQNTRYLWWTSSIGSRIIPYQWFNALEKAEDNSLIRANANLARFGFIHLATDAQWNPEGLPIGMVIDSDNLSGRKYLGLNCAACHTGKITYQNQEYIIDGAPGKIDFDLFLTEIAVALQKTIDNSDKFARFSKRVLGYGATLKETNSLKMAVSKKSIALAQNLMVNHPQTANGYGRLDASGILSNAVSVFSLAIPTNKTPVNAPVTYPTVWNARQMNATNWTGSTTNAGIGSHVRDVSKIIGLLGNLKLQEHSLNELKTIHFEHTVNIKQLDQLENLVGTLWSPIWPEQLLPPIHWQKAAQGKEIYYRECENCHSVIQRDNTAIKIKTTRVQASDVGTDPLAATNLAKDKVKTGILTGQSSLPVSDFISGLPKFTENAYATDLVNYAAVGVLRDSLNYADFIAGLPTFISAKQKTAESEQCPQTSSQKKCPRSISYNARPLNGIWSSAPFLHNGSVPNLWELLQTAKNRITKFYVGSWQFDPVKVGFNTQGEIDTSELDTAIAGNSNAGHEYGTQLSDAEKMLLIEYIKTL